MNPIRVAVLNPGGNDPEQAFPGFAGPVDDRVHAPVNYHAYTACTAGNFHRDIKNIGDDQNAVLLLLRRDLKKSLVALKSLKTSGKKVAVSWKESGSHQIASQLADATNILLFREICALADGAISSTPDLVPLYRAAGAMQVEFIPTPYPVGDPRWDFSVPTEQRRGVFIGTREFDVPSRNHLAALTIAATFGEPVTVFNTGGRSALRLLSALNIPNVTVITGPIPYSQYLQHLARHKIVFQLDRSAVPGQVGGDALLCRLPCIGGDSATERLAFPDLTGYGRDYSALAEMASRLLSDPAAYSEAVDASQTRARDLVSFEAVAERLRKFFGC